jgi:hypothetical protein
VPEGEEKMHLATDLAGVTPATYDPNNKNWQAAVSSACFHIRDRVNELVKESAILYDSGSEFKGHHFKGVEGYIWKDGEKVGNRAQGSLSFEQGGTMRIERTNAEGRFEIHLRQNGPQMPSFTRKHDPVYRVLHISCDVKVDGGNHALRLVLKNEKTDKWEADDVKNVVSNDWVNIECYMHIPTTVDVFLRIDDEAVSKVPSRVYIRNLKVVDES